MYKEMIISIVIAAIIIIGDIIIQNYTKKNIENINQSLQELKEILLSENNEESTKKIEQVHDNLNKVDKTFAFFIEHDELEKVETNLILCDSFIRRQNYVLAISELDKTVYVLDHIKDRYAFNLENIF